MVAFSEANEYSALAARMNEGEMAKHYLELQIDKKDAKNNE